MTHERVWYGNSEITLKKVKTRWFYKITGEDWNVLGHPQSRSKRATIKVAKMDIDFRNRPLPIGPYMGRWVGRH